VRAIRFKQRSQGELARLDDERLVGYLREAADAGDADASRDALAILVFRYEGLVRAKVLLKVDPVDADDLVAEVFMSALKSAFGGATPAELRAWLLTITKRRIADYHRSGGLAGGFELIDPTGGDEEEARRRPEPAHEGEAGAVETELVLDGLLDGLGDAHRLVVELYVVNGFSARECVERVNGQLGDSLDDPMTEANVHQIGSRFRANLRAALGGGDPARAGRG
jgi:RNA polymerase sigma factor (sigma-70 family)